MFENMQPQLMEASPWQSLRNSHDKGLVYAHQYTRTFRREHLGMRSLWRIWEILAAITVFKPRPETPAPGQIATALHMDLSLESLKCALHRPITKIESVD
jgi:hypothetical protein